MAKEGFLGAIGRFASALTDAAPEGPRNVLYAISPWISELTRSASQHWLPHLLLGIPCEVLARHPTLGVGIPCPSPAIAACSVCRKPVCLEHAFVARSGQAVCFACVKQDIDDHAPRPQVDRPDPPRRPPPHPGAPPDSPHADGRYEPRAHAPPPRSPPDPTLSARVAAARKVLGVTRRASWTKVEAAYKELLVQHHPDRNPQDRHAAETRFKEVRVAFDLLKHAREQEHS